ncbi:MAG: DUF3307 domain-containing protein, partial [Lachnospiraceae bacterium]|nr:DUF3307 domain-containing protein [Lachnospiraceae bacterium]
MKNGEKTLNNILLFGLIGHVLGDFYFQSNSLSKEKEASARAMLIHCLLYCVPFLLVSIFLIKTPQLMGFLLLCGGFHMVIDALKYRFLVRTKGRIRRAFSKKSVVYIADQLLHISSIILLALYFSKTWEIHCISTVTCLLSQTPYNSHTLA